MGVIVAIEVTMPKLSDTMEEGKILKWLVAEGDEVSSGDVIAEIETDKADMEMEAFEDGFIVKIVKAEGESAAVGEVIAFIGEAGEKVEAPAAGKKPEKKVEPQAEKEEPEKKEAEPKPAEKKQAAGAPKPEPSVAPPAAAVGAAVKASPIARRLADAAGVDIREIPGSGPEGRIVKRDVEAFLGGNLPKLEPSELIAPRPEPAAEPTPAAVAKPQLAGTRVPLSSMRKTVAKRLSESKFTAPHYYVTIEVDMGPAMEARAVILEQDGVKISPNDFIVKACARALIEHPQVNAGLEGDEIVYHESADIGVAVALEEGLITPVVRDCQNKTLSQISAEIRELAERARARKLLPEEYSGNSFSISNLGMFGVDAFTAIINPPASAILAVGRVTEVPVAVDGRVTVGKRMKMTLSSDHRIVDGAVAAQFLATVKSILENPMRMLI